VFNTPGPVTEAVNWKVSPVARVAVDGETCTRIPESTTTVRKPNALVFAQLVATTRKVFGCGGAPGAAYRPVEVMVPNPVSGEETVGMGQDAGPCPWLQSVGATVVDCGVLVGLQICQKTLVEEPPETLAANCTALFTRTVTPPTVALELTALTVTPTGVEFDAQPPAHTTRSISTVPSPAAFMSLPPSNPRLNVPRACVRGRPSPVASGGLQSFIRMSG
jgi:hypothetical protein